MIKHNFSLVNYDTDSITICKKDGAEFSEEEQYSLLKELNSLYDENITWDHDGYFNTIIVMAAKNYVLYDGKKIKIKGSALKASTKSKLLKSLISDVVNVLCFTPDLEEAKLKIQKLYQECIKKAANVNNPDSMRDFAARKTISSTMMTSTRTNETKVMDAIKDSTYVEGDRVWVFYLPDDSLCLIEDFSGEYNKVRLYKNIYDTISVFSDVLPIKDMFLNYALKKNLPLVDQL